MLNRGKPLFTWSLVGAFILTFVMAYGLAYTRYSPDFRPTVTPRPTPGPTSTPTPIPPTPTPRPTPTMGPTPTTPLTIQEVASWCKGYNSEDCNNLELTQHGGTITYQSNGCYGEFRIPPPNVAKMKYQQPEHRDGHKIAIAQWQEPINNIDTNILIHICWAEFTRP